METGMTVAYELIRSKRRTIAIVIDSEGKCRVRAPLQARLSDIEHFVQAKTGWIEQKQQHYAAVQKKRQLILTDGMQLSVLDNSYTLRLTEVGQVQVNGTVLVVSTVQTAAGTGKMAAAAGFSSFAGTDSTLCGVDGCCLSECEAVFSGETLGFVQYKGKFEFFVAAGILSAGSFRLCCGA